MADETPPKTKSSPVRKILLFLVFVLVAVGAGGAAAYTQRDQLGLAEDPEAEAPLEFGAFAELESIVINPRGTSGQRYLMVKLGVEAEDEETLDELGNRSPAARDAVLSMLASQTVEELSDVTQRDSLKADILTSFNRILGDEGPLTRVYFTQFVLQ